MAGTIINLAFVVLMAVFVAFCVVGSLTAMGIMLWRWQKELNESARLRHVRSTQLR